MAIVLYHLQRHEHKSEEIFEKLEGIIDRSEIRDAINRLLQLGYIIKREEAYRVNIEKLIQMQVRFSSFSRVFVCVYV